MLNDFISLIFPEYCAMCRESLARTETHICLHCHYNLPRTHYHLCIENELMQRFWGRIELVNAWAYVKFTKKGTVQRALHELKYGGNREVGVVFGQWYGNELTAGGFNRAFDWILPIPLHPSKLKKRGYNQSDAFAEGLSQTMQVAWSSEILQRTVASETQTRKGRMQRWENVKDIFCVPSTDCVKDKRILLVDDVVTTGATFEACAHVLREAGCRNLSIAAIATA